MIYKVWVDNFDYDQYDSFIVIADSKEEILNNFEEESWGFNYKDGYVSFGKKSSKNLK